MCRWRPSPTRRGDDTLTAVRGAVVAPAASGGEKKSAVCGGASVSGMYYARLNEGVRAVTTSSSSTTEKRQLVLLRKLVDRATSVDGTIDFELFRSTLLASGDDELSSFLRPRVAEFGAAVGRTGTFRGYRLALAQLQILARFDIYGGSGVRAVASHPGGVRGFADGLLRDAGAVESGGSSDGAGFEAFEALEDDLRAARAR